VISTLLRRVVLGTSLACLLFSSAPPASGALVATKLLCDFTSSPLGVDEVSPHLSWQLQPDVSTQTPSDSGTVRDQSQMAYQILVAASPSALAADQGDLWDSGKVLSGSSVDITYAGLPLTSAHLAFWKLRVWDQSGRVSAWSAPATWTMGLLAASDWRGSWLFAQTNVPLPLFRREFIVKPGLQRALIFICGLGQYELTANGQKIGNNLLAPGWSKYDKTCLYDSYDATANLRPGANALGVMLGNGMYNVERSSRYAKFTGSFGPPKLIAQLHLFYSDGTSEVIATDPLWRVAPGPLTFSSVFGGEDFDAVWSLLGGISRASTTLVGCRPWKPKDPVVA
jgi:alpha-L-rhamnosidase